MKEKSIIKFVTSEATPKSAQGETCYQGQLRHNAVLSVEDTKREFADYCGEKESLTTRYVDAMTEFIAANIRKGNHIDFGGFTVGLKLGGGFKGANAPFDERFNNLKIKLTPSKKLKDALLALKPINVTVPKRSYMNWFRQTSPFELHDQITCLGTRVIAVTGCLPPVNPESPDEGIWIEDDLGNRLLTGTAVKSEFARTDCEFTGPLDRGLYWAVIQGRYGDDQAVIRAQRRIEAIAMHTQT